MHEYELEILINELQKLVVTKETTLRSKGYKIDSLEAENKSLNEQVATLKAEIERLEHLLTQKTELKQAN